MRVLKSTFDIHKHLVERCKKNDRQAQKEIYDLYSVSMFNVSLRILNSREEAEDVLQEAFVEVFSKIHSYRGESTFGAWFKRIVINKSINALKKKKYFSEDIESVANEAEEDEDVPDEEYTIQHIKDAMFSLKPGFRAVFSLYMFEDYSHQEIADELGISVGTSKSQLSRAKQRVKQILISNKRVS